MKKNNSIFLKLNTLIAAIITATAVQAAPVYDEDGKTVEFNVEGMANIA